MFNCDLDTQYATARSRQALCSRGSRALRRQHGATPQLLSRRRVRKGRSQIIANTTFVYLPSRRPIHMPGISVGERRYAAQDIACRKLDSYVSIHPLDRLSNVLCMHLTITCCLKFCSQQEHLSNFWNKSIRRSGFR